MRLDQFLKISRLIVRRSLAQEFCDTGLIDVNGLQAKSSKEIKVGDEIEIRRRNRITRVRVVEVPGTKQMPKKSAAGLYEMISETEVDDDLV
ncbi:MAG TPA: S4 domain-containing protein [Pyrinomonadaceae bacterium]|nr:S4 domain-containing protein [Pyrinomonadaceae bacterium]